MKKLIMNKKTYLGLYLILLLAQSLIAQPPPPMRWVKVILAPNHADWKYKLGEKVQINIQVLKSNVPIPNASITYNVGPEKMPPTITKTEVLKNGATSIEVPGLQQPGFLRCEVTAEYDGVKYREITTAAFEPEQIQATVTDPADFDAFWSNALAENAKIPMDTKMTLLPERCTDHADVYHVSVQNWRPGARLYGILSVPKTPGRYPAVLKVPGAGIRPYTGDVDFANNGVISFEIGVHGISVIMPQQNYDDLLAGWNNQYWLNNLNNRDRYAYKRIYLGCIRANDLLASLPQWDGRNLAVMGSSQGGALSIVTAALDPRVTAAAPIHPALCDMTGSLHNRAGGWPQPFANAVDVAKPSHADNLNTVGYYDVVNFAKRLKVPVAFSFGYNDETCPPTSIYAAYNVIKSPKQLFLALETGHWIYTEQQNFGRNWVRKQLGNL
jgi:cephalosporin-C deacetylase